ncbi:MAG: potassium-transporting ATPase subunit KdpA [Candidatus Binatus sp.]|uniref:potassium-transporting ATPase subunit KdpA n=1 Tax=Candidatus Binatus sp. TaxID=2811406 RepID=UPI003C72DE4A
MWLLPVSIIVFTILIAIPLSRYMAKIMDGKYKAPQVLAGFEERLDSGPQNWKQYTIALLAFNTVLFVYGYIVLSVQPWMPLNPRGLGMLAPSTIFNTVISFITNTNIQHYSGDVAFSNFTQIFFCVAMFFLSAAVGLCALTAIIRALRSDSHLGNFFLDMWRVVIYMFFPAAFVMSMVFLVQGMPMTYQSDYQVSTLEPAAMGTDSNNQPKQQTIVVGPLAAFVPMKMMGTNGGGFYGMNSAHPFENPGAGTNFFETFCMMLFPMALVLMYGRMLSRFRHSVVIFSVMLLLFVGTIVWAIYFDTMQPNPGLTAHPQARTYTIASASAPGGKREITLPAVAGLPVDQHLGNLEGKELRFGTSAGATFAAATVDVTCGAVNAEHDSLNPIAGLSPFVGMWLNCIYGGKGVGMINLLLFLIIGIFLAGQMVGRTPEYLGKKIGAREMKLAMIALLVHPILILGPSGLFAATDWGMKATSNPGAHGLSQIVYQFSSSSANNGSAFDGLGTSYGLNSNPSPAPEAVPWDIAGGLVILFGRYLPIVAPIAMAAFLGMKKSTPFGLGTLRDDTATFGCLLLGTIVIVGALLFLPVAALGPLADHLGPIPFGG